MLKKIWFLLLVMGICSNLDASEEETQSTEFSRATLLALMEPSSDEQWQLDGPLPVKTISELITLDHVPQLYHIFEQYSGDIAPSEVLEIVDFAPLEVAISCDDLESVRMLLNPAVSDSEGHSLAQSLTKRDVQLFLSRFGYMLPWDKMREALRDVLSREIRSFAILPRLSYRLLQFLLEQPGINVDYQNDFNRNTALHQIFRPEPVRLLLAAGARCDIKNRECETALHKAAEIGACEAVRLLLNYGARSDIEDRNGRTAFEAADQCSNWGNRSAVKALIREARTKNYLKPFLKNTLRTIPTVITDLIADMHGAYLDKPRPNFMQVTNNFCNDPCVLIIGFFVINAITVLCYTTISYSREVFLDSINITGGVTNQCYNLTSH